MTFKMLMIKYVRACSCIRIKVIILEETASKNKMPEQYITHILSSRFKILFVIESAKIIITEKKMSDQLNPYQLNLAYKIGGMLNLVHKNILSEQML